MTRYLIKCTLCGAKLTIRPFKHFVNATGYKANKVSIDHIISSAYSIQRAASGNDPSYRSKIVCINVHAHNPPHTMTKVNVVIQGYCIQSLSSINCHGGYSQI